ncbi:MULTISPECIES: phosphoadenosine phosphosulfate reductase family protein [unclassified Acinetobacter]|uniref:phosphoadenosine phosphosulfate reductase domain-containing protein n=1 Tax=unclassified Acinetobacter TaxID=196816 RepID=UPI002934D4C3|nr:MULTISPECIES: phosphoadenosine phosphosulfate reductase family protein [unclassified Acinetobacter]WOE32771.1 phosphoadenosine phosphosulfate reductase family protein [Acinetobacter sp. SAAs470]WOE38248.1 phosphoadenosine phosphosulfate reductase family protein [Acinetobacter sp. SAAs474]
MSHEQSSLIFFHVARCGFGQVGWGVNAYNKILTTQVQVLTSDFVVVSYGGGTNSTALLIEYVNRGMRVDLIMFADTGAEKPHTYKYVEYFSQWLESKGYPAIKVVKANKSLEQDCLDRKALPSLAYGLKTCSQRFKIAPQDKAVNNTVFVAGRIVKVIGYDADEPQRASRTYDDKFTRVYPLIEWGMGRDECIQSIRDAGLALPGKSACYFCPNSRPSEIKWLEKFHPELLERALLIEKQADLTKVVGLGRKFSWKSIQQHEDAFMAEYTNFDIPCGCYDGGEA